MIFCGSFNKSLFPGLRIGYIVAPPSLAPALANARATTGRANPVLDQLTMIEFMRSGAFLRHLKRTRQTYKARLELVLGELRSAGWCNCDFLGVHAGFHFVLRLPPGADEDEACVLATEVGVVVQGIRSFSRGSNGKQTTGLVIGYTALSDSQAKWFARRLAIALAPLRERPLSGPCSFASHSHEVS